MMLAVVLDVPPERASNTRGWKNAPALRHFSPYLFTLTRSCSLIFRFFSTHPYISSLLLVVARRGKEGRLELSSISTSARSRFAARRWRTRRSANYTRPLSCRCARCVSARAVEEWQSRHLRRPRRRQQRKGGTGNCVSTVRHHSS
jgi:hypothetical protein